MSKVQQPQDQQPSEKEEEEEELSRPLIVPLFGSGRRWNADLWRPQHDRDAYSRFMVRNQGVEFNGTLLRNNKNKDQAVTSQLSPDRHRWDLFHSWGLRLRIGTGDSIIYTISVTDKVPPWDSKDETVEWYRNFPGTPGDHELLWDQFQPVQEGSRALDRSNISGFRISIAKRVHMNTTTGVRYGVAQTGLFNLVVVSICVCRE